MSVCKWYEGAGGAISALTIGPAAEAEMVDVDEEGPVCSVSGPGAWTSTEEAEEDGTDDRLVTQVACCDLAES